MKSFLLFVSAAAVLLHAPQLASAQAPPPLGVAASFALFTAVGEVKNAGPTIVNGNIGTNAGAFTGFPPGVVNNGNIYVASTFTTQAATDVQTAYQYFSSNIPCVTTLALYGGTPAVALTPGSYCVNGATTLAGTLILDAGGVASAKFYLRVSGGALTTAANSTVVLANGASANNVYWQISGGAVNLGQNSTMQGTLLVDGAISMDEGTTLIGRGLSRGGAILPTSTPTAISTFSLPIITATSWLGTAQGGLNTDWYTAANWSDGVPTSLLDAIVPTGTTPYPVLTAGNAAAKSLTIGTSATFTQQAGTLDLKNAIANSGTISATGGSVTLTGTTAQAIGGSGSTQLWNLAVGNTAGASQTSALRLHGVLALTSGSLLTNGQPLTLLSDAVATALVVNTGSNVVNGAVTVQRYIDGSLNPGLGYRQFGSPVSGATVASFSTGTTFSPVLNQAFNTSSTGAATPFPNVFAYDQSRLATITSSMTPFDQGFVVPATTTTPLAAGTGYDVNIAAGQTVSFTGTAFTGDLTKTLSRNTGTTAADAGWALLANPYPAPLDYALVLAADRPSLDAAIYVVQSSGQYTGQYRSFVNGLPAGGGVLPSSQAFFTRVSSGQTSGSLTFHNTQRLTAANNTAFQRTTADLRPQVQLDLAGNGRADTFTAYAEAGATSAFDSQYDAAKLPNSTGLNLASLAVGEALAIDGRAAFTTTTALALTVGVPAAGAYTITAANIANLPAGLDAYLRDALTGQTTKLSAGSSYSFGVTAAQAAATIAGRFTLQFSSQNALATAPSLSAAEVTVYPNPAHSSFVVLVPAVASATSVKADLLNTLGQVVRRQAVTLPAAGTTLTVETAGLATGVYTLRLQAGASTLAKRVVIQ